MWGPSTISATGTTSSTYALSALLALSGASGLASGGTTFPIFAKSRGGTVGGRFGGWDAPPAALCTDAEPGWTRASRVASSAALIDSALRVELLPYRGGARWKPCHVATRSSKDPPWAAKCARNSWVGNTASGSVGSPLKLGLGGTMPTPPPSLPSLPPPTILAASYASSRCSSLNA